MGLIIESSYEMPAGGFPGKPQEEDFLYPIRVIYASLLCLVMPTGIFARSTKY
jgi:hypothetical protein